ncbi:MAG: hypothetical protein A2464_07425 [Deltaproteobacteria bacterium RIFOXYC2_FULL_48_10]|nr:MAG: hypothetical protein A2464_07425 [Deltaproteobacteria bacterium RIFOXYC2_FULL_48_10]
MIKNDQNIFDNSINNPLGNDPKREKSGSYTFKKYNYQYHWAFCKMLDEHSLGKNYALFIEEHEDVTLADSLDGAKVLFEFYQVKETNKKHTINSLSKIDKNKKNSILGKLGESVGNKSYGNRIKKVALVSTGGYSFDIHKKGFSLEVIDCGDLSYKELDVILECLETEVGDGKHLDNFIEKIAFIVPDLPDQGFDDVVEGRISKLINKITPGCKYNPGRIYECVIRDLYRKGENTFDYKKWGDSLKNKAITRDQFQGIIDQFISRKPDESVCFEFLQILTNEYNLSSIKRREVQTGFYRYYTKRISERNPMLLSVSKEICLLIDKHSEQCNNAPELEMKVKEDLSVETKIFFNNDKELTGAFLYELITGF